MSYECWKEELSGQGILVGSVKPGVVDTAMQEQIRNLDEERFPMLENFRSLKRNNDLLDPNTVSRFLAWLLIDANRKSFRRRTRIFVMRLLSLYGMFRMKQLSDFKYLNR